MLFQIRKFRTAIVGLVIFLLSVFWVLGALDDDGNIALVRNDVLVNANNERIWLGSVTNTTDSQYRDIEITIRFLDARDEPVGEVSDTTDVLDPGETLDLQAVLAPEAVRMQMFSLSWRTGRKNKSVGNSLGPWAPWTFGRPQTQWPKGNFQPHRYLSK